KPSIGQFQNSAAGRVRIHLEEVDGISTGARYSLCGAGAEVSADQRAQIGGVTGKRTCKGSSLSLLQPGDELSVGIIRGQGRGLECLIENWCRIWSLEGCPS